MDPKLNQLNNHFNNDNSIRDRRKYANFLKALDWLSNTVRILNIQTKCYKGRYSMQFAN